MTEDHDNKISDLYRTVSQETPPSHLDRAVLDLARQSGRRKIFSPFGNHWVSGAALAVVVVMSVVLVQLLPQRPDDTQYLLDRDAPSVEELQETGESAGQLKELRSRIPGKAETQQLAPEAPAARFNFYKVLPETDQAPQDAEPAIRAGKSQAVEEDQSAGALLQSSAVGYYLQAGSFREGERALQLKQRLVGLGFECDIQEVRINGEDVYHRVRIGPFTNPDALRKSKEELAKLGYETREVLAE